MVLLRRGWCGGTVLHEAVSYSNHMLVEEVIKRLRMVLDENLSKGANASAKVSLAEMVNAQNREGSTPLHFAVQLGDRETAEALVAAGARRDLADRFGRYPLPKLSGTDLQKIIQPVSVTGANAAQFIELFAAAFSGTQHLHTRAVAIDLINQHVRGEKRLLVEGRVIEGVQASIYNIDGRAIGFVVTHPHPLSSRALVLAYAAVLPEFQRHGLGSAIIEQALDQARGRGYRSALLSTEREEWNKGTVLFHQKLGFRVASDVASNNTLLVLRKKLRPTAS